MIHLYKNPLFGDHCECDGHL